MNIEDIINKIKNYNFNCSAPSIICVNAMTYKKICEEIQETNIDYYNYNFSNIYKNMQLVIDNSLKNDEVEIR